MADAVGPIAQEDQDRLAQLLGGKIGGAAGSLLYPQNGPANTPGPVNVAGGPPMAPPAGTPGIAAKPAPQATDDPTLQAKTSPMPGAPATPPLPVPPTFQNPPLQTMQDLSAKIAQASQPIRRQDHQAPWWQKLLAIPYAGLEGIGDPARGAKAGAALINAPYNRALENQQKTISPLEAEFERQSKVEPHLRDTNENAQRTFTDQDAAYKNFNATQDRQAAIDERAQAAKDRNEERQDEASHTPAPGERPYLGMVNGKPGLVVKTKTGDVIPYTPKSIDEGAMLGDETATRLYNRAHPEKEGDKPADKKQFLAVETARDQGWGKARREYDTATKDLNPANKADANALSQAREEYYQKRQDTQDEYEQKIGTLGGTANHVELPRNHFGEKPAEVAKSADAASSAPKTVPKSTVQAYATKKGIAYNLALKGFQQKGYQVK